MKVYIWGTGKIASHIIKMNVNAEILGYIETQPTKDNFAGKKICRCNEIALEYDAVIVANAYPDEVYEMARKHGIPVEKLIFMRKCHYVNASLNLNWKHQILGDGNFELYLDAHALYEQSFFAKDKQLYIKLNARPNFTICDENNWPIIQDKFAKAGTVDNYFLQDLWAAKIIHKNLPQEHLDIGSRLDGFIAHVLSFGIPVRMIDIRPFPIEIEGLDTIVDDATELKQFEDNSIESLSALCSLEHFGLGRYGDAIDPEACFKCFERIQTKMKAGGHVYIAVPIGKERVEFNAHRVFYPQTILNSFNKLHLEEFSCAAEGHIEINPDIHKYDNDPHNGEYRYGLFHFIKQLE